MCRWAIFFLALMWQVHAVKLVLKCYRPTLWIVCCYGGKLNFVRRLGEFLFQQRDHTERNLSEWCSESDTFRKMLTQRNTLERCSQRHIPEWCSKKRYSGINLYDNNNEIKNGQKSIELVKFARHKKKPPVFIFNSLNLPCIFRSYYGHMMLIGELQGWASL